MLAGIVAGTHPFAAAITNAKRPMVIVGMGALAREDGDAIYTYAKAFALQAMQREGWNSFNVLHTAAARVGALDVRFVPQAGGRDIAGILDGAERGDVSLLYLLGVDEIDTRYFGDAFVVYQGHHGDIGAARADVVLPSAAYTEQDGTYVNLEGRPQQAQRAVFPVGEAKEGWKILRALSEALDCTLPYNTLEQLREHMVAIAPHLAYTDAIVPSALVAEAAAGIIHAHPFEEVVTNFYMTDPISRVSPTMAACTREVLSTMKEAA
jgi:NADH-quinone oxidoreductase subunit G